MSGIQEVDVVMAGAGGGAYPAAFRLARAGMTVVMADPKGVMSGNCLAEGCVPSKTVREIAHHRLRQERFGKFGLPGNFGVDYSRIVAHKDMVQRERYDQHALEIATQPKIRLVKGRARFIDAHTVAVEGDRGEDRYRARFVLVASGSDIWVPPFPGADRALTSRDLFALSPTLAALPDSMGIIGGGYIGLETAAMFRALGVDVTLFEQGPRVLSGMDEEMVDALASLLDPSIRILTEVHVQEIRKGPGGEEILYRTGETGEIRRSSFSRVMVAAGRRPVIPEGLAAVGVEVSKRGIVVDPGMRTSLPHIFAAGDVNGITPLFHAAVRQSLVSAHNILGGEYSLDYYDPGPVPTTIFTLPEAAYVGLVPETARKKGIPVIVGRYDFSEDSRAQILGETGGGITLLFEPSSLRLLGGTIVGVDAGNLVGEIGLALAGGLTARDLSGFADQHPMASEGIGKAARSLF